MPRSAVREESSRYTIKADSPFCGRTTRLYAEVRSSISQHTPCADILQASLAERSEYGKDAIGGDAAGAGQAG